MVGAGFAGLYMAYRLREAGFSVQGFEAGDDVGGTWYWNCYPGARCDIESLQYSYQFSDELQQSWRWSEKYATQGEILDYIRHVTDRFSLRQHFRFNTQVTKAHFDGDENRWLVETDTGRVVAASICVMAVGCLSTANHPNFPGAESYEGAVYHTGTWPQEGVDFSGLKVGVIGTGSSGIQCVPFIAEQAKHLSVFQRTPNYATPAWNEPLTEEQFEEARANYADLRAQAKTRPTGYVFPFNDRSALDDTPEQRREVYERQWRLGGLKFLGAYSDLLFNTEANDTIAKFAREKIRKRINDPAVADLLVPEGVIGSKRLCVESGYYETFNRDNVTLVDVSEHPIDHLTPGGLVVADQEYSLDAIVFATGFDAMVGSLNRINLSGNDGLLLSDKWQDGPRTYLGLASAGFPNLFTINGPGSPSVLSNMVQSAEHHVDWIMGCLQYMREHGYHLVEVERSAEDEWVAHNEELVAQSLRASRDSWYVGANISGKPRVFMPYAGGVPAYLEKSQSVAESDYAGFSFA